MSGETLDGVHSHNGDSLCLLSCQTGNARPGPSPVARASCVNCAVESFVNDTSCSSSTIPESDESVGKPRGLTVPDQNGPMSVRTSSSSARLRPILTLADLRKYRKLKKDRLLVPSPLKESIEHLQKYIKDRDHIFYIDDSDTMSPFKDAVADAFTLFSYVAKKVDTDGVEIVFGSNPTQIFRKKQTTPLSKRLGSQKFDEPREMMEGNFGKFVKKILIPRLSWSSRKDLSVLIFTDGRWGDDTEKAAGVEGPVKYLMQEMVRRDVGRTPVMLSFIQFGDDDIGKMHLEYLDNFGKELELMDMYSVGHTW